jgi:hypothetical protein
LSTDSGALNIIHFPKIKNGSYENLIRTIINGERLFKSS